MTNATQDGYRFKLTGMVSKLGMTGICMDGSTHLLHTAIGNFRLKPENKDAEAVLDSLDGKRMPAAVYGNAVAGVEGAHCNHIAVQRAEAGL